MTVDTLQVGGVNEMFVSVTVDVFFTTEQVIPSVCSQILWIGLNMSPTHCPSWGHMRSRGCHMSSWHSVLLCDTHRGTCHPHWVLPPCEPTSSLSCWICPYYSVQYGEIQPRRMGKSKLSKVVPTVWVNPTQSNSMGKSNPNPTPELSNQKRERKKSIYLFLLPLSLVLSLAHFLSHGLPLPPTLGCVFICNWI